MAYFDSLSGVDDSLMIIQLMRVERRRFTGGAGTEDPLVERAQKIHLVDQIHIGLYNKGL